MKRLVVAALAVSLTLAGQVAREANERYRTREGRQQIGRMLSRPDRDATQKPRELVAAMQLGPGMTVADVGTGVGYMLPYLSEAVGEKGVVLAQDIARDFLDRAKEAARHKNLTNIQYVLGTTENPNLPLGQVDVVLMLDAYHHFDYPKPMLAHIGEALKPDGRLVLVDYYKANFSNPGHIRLEDHEAIAEIEANGFRMVSRRDHIPKSQYMAIFVKKQP